MPSSYRMMTPGQRKTFWACFLGWALDAMDVQMVAFVIPTLLPLWGMTKGEAGIISTSTLMASALGGMFAGLLADRIGRVQVLKLAIAWFSLFTGLSALTNSFPQLLFTRSLQGLGFGGEWAAGAILIGEVVDKRIRGRAVGSVPPPHSAIGACSRCCPRTRPGARSSCLACCPVFWCCGYAAPSRNPRHSKRMPSIAGRARPGRPCP
jgi:sugar phosphate permease